MFFFSVFFFLSYSSYNRCLFSDKHGVHAGLNSQMLHCFYVYLKFEILKKQNREKKNDNDTDFWKGVVQVSDDATKKMLL